MWEKLTTSEISHTALWVKSREMWGCCWGPVHGTSWYLVNQSREAERHVQTRWDSCAWVSGHFGTGFGRSGRGAEIYPLFRLLYATAAHARRYGDVVVVFVVLIMQTLCCPLKKQDTGMQTCSFCNTFHCCTCCWVTVCFRSWTCVWLVFEVCRGKEHSVPPQYIKQTPQNLWTNKLHHCLCITALLCALSRDVPFDHV